MLALIDDSDCLNGLASLVKDIINGTLPVEARTLLVSSILIRIKKPSGGTRPIAMGETFYKLAGLYCVSLVPSKDIRAILEPIQFALSLQEALKLLFMF